MEGASIGLLFAGLTLLFCLSAFFSASETAIFSVSEIKIKNLAHSSAPDRLSAVLVDSFLGNKDMIIIGILLGNTFVNFTISSILTLVTARMFVSFQIPAAVGLLVTIPLTTLLLLIFGEIVPKVLAYRHNFSFSLWAARPLNLVLTMVQPLTWVFFNFSQIFLGLFGVEKEYAGRNFLVQRDKLMHYLTLGTESGTLAPEENEILSSAFDFGDLLTSNIMTPRTSMTCLPHDLDLEETLRIIKSSEFSRIPVYHRDLDDLLGILHAKDLLINKPKIITGGFRLSDFLRPCYYVPENKRVDKLLKELQKEKTHMAIVVDEFGGTAGLVTFQDILEEIVGDLEDDPEVTQQIIETSPNCYVIEGGASIDLIEERIGIKIPEGDFETLSGLIYFTLGRVPNPEEEILLANGLKFKVILIDGKEIRKVFFDSAKFYPPETQG